MSLFLLLLIVAIVLGFLGVLLKGVFWLLVIGIVVFLIDMVWLGARLGRNKKPPR
ncbi:MAG TPA: hypothetical protein VFT75_05775 [Nocardioidaceae bacterium]|jgi:hypothetical protein|nr:hypothetical protein [Nocardioidaceae bacterium]